MNESCNSIISAFTYAKSLKKSYKSNRCHKWGVLIALSFLFVFISQIVVIGLEFVIQNVFTIFYSSFQTFLVTISIILIMGFIVLVFCAGKLTGFFVSVIRSDDSTDNKIHGKYKALLIILIYLIPSILCATIVYGFNVYDLEIPFVFLLSSLPLIMGFITMSFGLFGLTEFVETNKFSSAFKISSIKKHMSRNYIRCLLIWFVIILITIHIIPLSILLLITVNQLAIFLLLAFLVFLSIFLPRVIAAFAHNVAECYAIKDSALFSFPDKNDVSNEDSNNKISSVWKKVLIVFIVTVVAISCSFAVGYFAGFADNTPEKDTSKENLSPIPTSPIQEKEVEVVNPAENLDRTGLPAGPMHTPTPMYGVPQSNELSSVMLTKETEVLDYE